MNTNCKQCGNVFTRSHTSVKYCSDKCRSLAKREQQKVRMSKLKERAKRYPRKKHCKTCNVMFVVPVGAATPKYCSDICRPHKLLVVNKYRLENAETIKQTRIRHYNKKRGITDDRTGV